MDRQLVLEFVRVTEAAAIACAPMIGRGDRRAADELAVQGMRKAFDRVPVRGTVVIGEGERDEAPMLYIGERLGPDRCDLLEVDIAVDPLEGTNLCATGSPGALTVLAVARKGHLLHAPDTYMHKLATGAAGKGVVSLDASMYDNVHALAEAKGRKARDMTVVLLERPRHDEMILELRRAGARVILPTDGDCAPAIATCLPHTGVDMVCGIGGAPEGVLSAAAIHSLGGFFQGRMHYQNGSERERAREMMPSKDPDRLLELNDVVRGDVIFCATGVTNGLLLEGVRYADGRMHLQSLALRASTGTIRWVQSAISPERLR